MNNKDVVLNEIKQKIIEKLKEDKHVYNPDIEEDKKCRKFFAIKTVDLETATAENIKDYSDNIVRAIKCHISESEIKGTIHFKIFGLDCLHDRDSFSDLLRGIFYYKPVATEYDKIKSMNMDQMAQFLFDVANDELLCDICANDYNIHDCCARSCIKSIKEWLSKESKDEVD